MRVTKRDGSDEDVSFDKVLRRIRVLCTGLVGVDAHSITQKVCTRIYDGVRTSELDELAAQMCASLVTEHPDYGLLAARIIVSNHHKNTSPSFSETMGMLYNATDVHGKHNPLISDELWTMVQMHKEKLNSVIDYERDYLFDYFGFKTLERSYLMKVGGKTVERPQHLWMRVALGIHGTDLKDAIETYDMMSRKKFTHATPTLFNAGTRENANLASCFLMDIRDSIKGIFKTITDCALISKVGGGIGIHIHDIRARGSHIRGTNGHGSGIIPMLRVMNSTACYVNQSGRRAGSIALYLEPWHADVESFLDIRKNHGNEEERCRDLFTALWIPDLFMRRVQENGEWSLMCPDESRGLAAVYGEEFDALYEKYEAEGKYRKKVKAQTLWLEILKSQIETGTPYLCYKDAANKKTNQKNVGVIRSSNLCVAPETLILTDQGERTISALAGQKASVWNGHEWSDVIVYQTSSHSPLVRVHIRRAGEEVVRTIDCTYYHRFYLKNGTNIRAGELAPGMELLPFKVPTSDGGNILFEPVIEGIEHTGRIDKTFCFNEPLRHMGVFNGVLTGQCSEIMEYSDETEASTCNLASIALPNFIKEGVYDFEELHRAAQILTKNINKVIDRTYYPTPETEKSNRRHRPIGLGVQGLADVYAILRMAFDSPDAAELNKKIFATIYHGAVTASMAIAKKRQLWIEELNAAETTDERRTEIEKSLHRTVGEVALTTYPGAYETFDGSPASQGQLQYDLWGVQPDPMWDWNTLKQEIAQYGMRNSLLLAPMPTASTSQILSSNECFEPFTSNFYQRRTLAGEFTIINKYLIRDLIARDLWSPQMKNMILASGGSVQTIESIPQDIKDLYKTAWEIKQKVLIDQAADRGVYVCQSQSLNLFVEDAEFSKLTNMHFYAWKRGLKTGIYYLRTRPKAKTMAFTLDPTTLNKSPQKLIKQQEDEKECLMCSA